MRGKAKYLLLGGRGGAGSDVEVASRRVQCAVRPKVCRGTGGKDAYNFLLDYACREEGLRKERSRYTRDTCRETQVKDDKKPRGMHRVWGTAPKQ